MKKISILILIAFKSFTQSFTAETGYLYLGEKDTELNGGMEIKSGTIKKGDIIDIYAPTGRKFTATITKITDKEYKEITQVKAGQFGFFDFKFTENPSTGKDYVTNGYKVYPAGFKPNMANMKAEEEAKVAKSVNFTSTLDGKSFRGKVTAHGAALWRKGVKGFAYNLPYLMLQFACVDSPDERLLTIQVFNPLESIKKYTALDMEVNFSGTADGLKDNTEMYGFVYKKGDTNFTMEITKWQKVGNKVIISGKVNGALKEIKVLGKATKMHTFKDGVFENI